MPKKLRVFLCHASEDKPAVCELYQKLMAEPWIEPWLDEEDLLPGQDFDLEIYKATRDADAIIICLSKTSVAKEGYVNKEIRRAYDIALEKPEGAIYVIPLRLDECSPSFEYLRKLHWADYFKPKSHERLVKALRLRADALKIETSETKATPVVAKLQSVQPKDDSLDLFRFIEINPQKSSDVDYPFWIGKYPVTNAQYERFLEAPDFASPLYWLEFPMFDEECKPIGNTGSTAADWLKEQLKESKSNVLIPRYWDDDNFGISKPNNPVVGISWYEANAYCEWLFQNWDALTESKANPSVKPQAIRLSLETEWVIAAGGDTPSGRYPWDKAGEATTSLKEKIRCANIEESGIGHTTAVDTYPSGKSPFGVMDMTGNVWEWQANYRYVKDKLLGLRGGSWLSHGYYARVSIHNNFSPNGWINDFGFRLVVFSREASL